MGLLLLIKTEFLGRIISTFIFAFLATWVSGTSILNTEIWFINNYNSTSGNFTSTHITTTITTPLNSVIIIMNIALSLASAVTLYKAEKKRREIR